MQEKFQNLPNNYKYNNVNSTHYNSNVIAAVRTGIKYNLFPFTENSCDCSIILFI